MGKRRTTGHYVMVARKRNAVWLGPRVPNANAPTQWRCLTCGHTWRTGYNSLKQGTGCKPCGTRRMAEALRTPPEAYHALASAHGLRWLGPPVPRTSENTGWECAVGHQYSTTFSKIQDSKRRCPVCARLRHLERSRRERHTPEAYHALAASRDFVWCGPEVLHAHAKTTWMCRQAEHRWRASYNKINGKRGCPECANARRAELNRHTPDAYHALAAERGLQWLGPPVRTVDKKTWWRCERGHSREASYNGVQKVRGCPMCADLVNGRRVSVEQRRLCRWLGGKLNDPDGRYRIDVAITVEGVRIAVEFDTWYFHGGRLDKDEERDQALIAGGWRVLRIRSPRCLPSREELDQAIRCVVDGETVHYLTLPGWGVGPVWEDRERTEPRD